jgi:septum formation inhibitor-activating ATPase MinD
MAFLAERTVRSPHTRRAYVAEIRRLSAPVSDAADRLAAVDALFRFAAGIDLRDRNLLSSSLAENAVSDFRPAAAKAGFDYPVIKGREVIVAALTASLATLDTTHSVTNPRVTINGDTARLDALVEALHVPRDDHTRHYLMKNRYDVELAREGDVWVITRNTVDNVWRSGDPAVLSVV